MPNKGQDSILPEVVYKGGKIKFKYYMEMLEALRF